LYFEFNINSYNLADKSFLNQKKMRIILIYTTLLFTLACKKTTVPTQKETEIETTPPPPAVWEIGNSITWADEFDQVGSPKADFWGYDLGGGGWGNNEKQVYTKEPDNVLVTNGNLEITAKLNKDWPTYTSTRLISKGKKDFLYGRIEIKAKLPSGRGTWPAIWTLASQSAYGDTFWPDNGELDIMEHVGYDQGRVHSNIHTRAFHHSINTNKGNSSSLTDVSEKFHIYSMDWLPTSVVFKIDGVVNFEFKKESWYGWREWPFDKPQHLLLNIAVGGNWGGAQGIDDSVFPQKMLIDYVRYYEAKKK
jgi:beta-glucanase (GH16 family)